MGDVLSLCAGDRKEGAPLASFSYIQKSHSASSSQSVEAGHSPALHALDTQSSSQLRGGSEGSVLYKERAKGVDVASIGADRISVEYAERKAMFEQAIGRPLLHSQRTPEGPLVPVSPSEASEEEKLLREHLQLVRETRELAAEMFLPESGPRIEAGISAAPETRAEPEPVAARAPHADTVVGGMNEGEGMELNVVPTTAADSSEHATERPQSRNPTATPDVLSKHRNDLVPPPSDEVRMMMAQQSTGHLLESGAKLCGPETDGVTSAPTGDARSDIISNETVLQRATPPSRRRPSAKRFFAEEMTSLDSQLARGAISVDEYASLLSESASSDDVEKPGAPLAGPLHAVLVSPPADSGSQTTPASAKLLKGRITADEYAAVLLARTRSQDDTVEKPARAPESVLVTASAASEAVTTPVSAKGVTDHPTLTPPSPEIEQGQIIEDARLVPRFLDPGALSGPASLTAERERETPELASEPDHGTIRVPEIKLSALSSSSWSTVGAAASPIGTPKDAPATAAAVVTETADSALSPVAEQPPTQETPQATPEVQPPTQETPQATPEVQQVTHTDLAEFERSIEAKRLMQKGCSFVKHGKRGKPHEARLRLSDDVKSLLWTSKKRGAAALCEVKKVALGKDRAGVSAWKRSSGKRVPEDLCLTIELAKGRTLNLEAPTMQARDEWASRIAEVAKLTVVSAVK